MFANETVLVDPSSQYLFALRLSTSFHLPLYKTETALEGDLRMFTPVE